MAVTLTGTGGLFTRLGKLGKLLKDTNLFQSATVPADFEAVAAQYDNARDVIAPFVSGQEAGVAACNAITGTLQTAAAATLNRMVYLDNRLPRKDDTGASLAELVAQMTANGQSVAACTVAVAAAAIAGSTGTGPIVTTHKRGDGRAQENLFAEVVPLKCVADAQSGGAPAGNEVFQFYGGAAQANALAQDWPLGSGLTTSLAAINGANDNDGFNLLTNGAFEDFATANVPDHWAIAAGVAGTDVFRSTSTFYQGASALRLAGGATNTSLTQTFNLAAGTAGTLLPQTNYGVNLWARVDVVPAAGVLTVDLVDGNNAVINDDQGVANSFTVSLPGLNTSFAAKNAVFRTPKVLPATTKLRLRLSTALSGGSNLFLDLAAFGALTRLYPGGPFAAVFAGATAFVAGDGWNLTTTNNRAGASNNATFQTLFDRLFTMRQYELLLPSAGSPTLSDSLIG